MKVDGLAVMVAILVTIGILLLLSLLFMLAISVFQYYGIFGRSIAAIITLLIGTIFLIAYKIETK